jgi:23S rRNA pseudouridine1911/1915/1917 synthase
MPEKPPRLEISVTLDTHERLDCWLPRMIPGLSRRRAAAMICEGAVTVDGRLPTKSEQVSFGSVIAILKPILGAMWSPLPDASIPLSLLYEDEHIAVVDKPSGISSVPLDPDEIGTLANAMVSMFPECAAVGRRAGDGGLLQRLDKETSGAVMVARTQTIHESMTKAQTKGEIEKRYLALVRGVPPTNTPPKSMKIDTPLAASGKKGRKMCPVSAGQSAGQAAFTEVRLISVHGDFSLVEAKILHGVRHQIRAHLAYAGYPIAGDPLYSDGVGPAGLTRLFLHAAEVIFFHPVTNQTVTVQAPLPAELAIMTIPTDK